MPAKQQRPKPSPSGRAETRRLGEEADDADRAAERAPAWTFLTNHAHVLIVLAGEPDLVLREVAGRVGITERAVQRIVQELESSGYLIRERVGRQNHYQIASGQRLRHPVEAHCQVDVLLSLVAKGGRPRRVSRESSHPTK